MKVSNIKKKFLAAKITAVLVYGAGSIAMIKPEPAYAGIPVIDVTSLTQHILNAIQNVQQVLQTIQSYQTQIQQFQNQIVNTLQPAAFLWDDANNIVNNLLNEIDTVSNLANQFGTIDNYLNRFSDINTYRNAPCLAAGCNRNQMTQWLQAQQNLKEDKSSELNDSNRAIIKGIEDQQAQIQADAQALRQLQNNAMGTQGEVQVLQSANQLSSNIASSLIQVRALLVSQQNAVAASQLLESDEKALQEAAEAQARNTRAVQQSPVVNWE